MSARTLFQVHDRSFQGNRYVYPVLSRRAGGISVGVNLNRDRSCNFNCIYCQVDRSGPAGDASIDGKRLAEELDRAIDLVTSGRIYRDSNFGRTPQAMRRLSDLALSGDGEPTAHPHFKRAVDVCAEVRRRHEPSDAKLVLITNASLLHRRRVRRALEVLDANRGEIWGKLDAGTERFYQEVARTAVPFQQILDNLRETASVRPIVIQTLLMRVFDEAPPPAELEAYCRRLNEILAAGGRIKLVQLHTVARRPAERWVTALSPAEIETAAELVRSRTGLAVATFSG